MLRSEDICWLELNFPWQPMTYEAFINYAHALGTMEVKTDESSLRKALSFCMLFAKNWKQHHKDARFVAARKFIVQFLHLNQQEWNAVSTNEAIPLCGKSFYAHMRALMADDRLCMHDSCINLSEEGAQRCSQHEIVWV